MNTKINVYILSIFLKLHNVLIILTVISVPSVLSPRRIYLWRQRSTKIAQKMFCHIVM